MDKGLLSNIGSSIVAYQMIVYKQRDPKGEEGINSNTVLYT